MEQQIVPQIVQIFLVHNHVIPSMPIHAKFVQQFVQIRLQVRWCPIKWILVSIRSAINGYLIHEAHQILLTLYLNAMTGQFYFYQNKTVPQVVVHPRHLQFLLTKIIKVAYKQTII